MRRLLVALLLVVAPVAPSAQLPPALLLPQHLQYLGSFRVPPQGFDYLGSAIAFNPARNSLFIVGQTSDGFGTAEIAIPELGGTASILQPLRDPLEDRLDHIGSPESRIGGQLVYRNRLYVTGYIYYDADGLQTRSHFSRPLNLGIPGQVNGPFRAGPDGAGAYSGYMGHVPPEWQAALGGPALTGQCCIPILSRTSFGPAVASFDPERQGSATTLLFYDEDHPLEPYGSRGSHPLFNGSTSVTGVVFPSGTMSVLFFGATGVGEYCYGNARDCDDPVRDEQGEHAYPYKPFVWMYDARDLEAVRDDRRDASAVRPYAAAVIEAIGEDDDFRSGGAAYDPATNRIYVSQLRGDGGLYPLIHVFSAGTEATSDPVLPPPSPDPPPTADPDPGVEPVPGAGGRRRTTEPTGRAQPR